MLKKLYLFLAVLMPVTMVAQQDEVAEKDYPILANTFIQINLGYLNYPYDEGLLNEGFTTSGYKKNPFSGRLMLGYKFDENWAIQYGVLRPAVWFEFEKVNGTNLTKSVFLNSWFLTLSRNFSLSDKWSIYTEAGPARVTRKGFLLGENRGVEDEEYFSLMAVGGLKYKLNNRWDLTAQAMYIPKHNDSQGAVSQFTAGFQYNLSELVPKEYHETTDVFFPKNTLQLGYSNDFIGFFANKFFSFQSRIGSFENFGVPVFWYGDVKASNTVHLNYHRTVYKGRKILSLGWGASATAFESSRDRDWVYALSIYPQIDFYFWREQQFAMYANYSLIGPTFISKENIDGLETGPEFTYQDFMGVGAYFGKDHSYNFELKIIHYSNGNIFNQNDGVAVPLMFTFGKSF